MPRHLAPWTVANFSDDDRHHPGRGFSPEHCACRGRHCLSHTKVTP